MEFSEEQQEAFNKYIEGKNVFITGPGGTGKSELIKAIYRDAISKNKKIQVTALTGCAAVLLECKAKTIHSWGGIGLAANSNEEIIKKITAHYLKRKNWKSTHILIVDEVSMLSLKIFDLLNELGRQIRTTQGHRPFGGIQLIFCGDFYQLPPVGDAAEPDTRRFCFESANWDTVFDPENQIQLKKIFRQRDQNYAKILNQIREGRITKSSVTTLLQHVGRPAALSISPTKMFPTRLRVEMINNGEMTKLTGEAHKYDIKALYDLPVKEKKDIFRTFTKDEKEIEINFLKNGMLCDKQIQLKVGAQVMCVVNITRGDDLVLCNGSQGIVSAFNEQGHPVVAFHNGSEIAIEPHVWPSEIIPGIGVSQIPLIMAWAITIHKAQGMSMDIAEIDVGSGVFECGQTYVALSRIKSLEGLFLTSFDVTKITVNKRVKEYYQRLNGLTAPAPVPVPLVEKAVEPVLAPAIVESI